MIFLSGCYDDRFLEAMNEEEDFIAPFDVVLNDDDAALRTTYFDIPGVDTSGGYTINPDPMTGNPNPAADGVDNVVLDKKTGLMWSRCTAIDKDNIDTTAICSESHTPMEWIYAAEFCKKKMNEMNGGTGYAGYTNWRLPRVPELISIINYNNEDPAIDASVFPNTISNTNEGYWTFTSKLFIGDYFETIDYGWIVFFNSSNAQSPSFTNIVDFRKKLKTDLNFEKQYVRCVRGGIEDPF